ncbi:MAG: hypothetical protein AAF488_10180 [Planctomycetota bacterium]
MPGCSHRPYRPVELPERQPPPVSLRPTFGGWNFASQVIDNRSDDVATVETFSFETYDDVAGQVVRVTGEWYRPTTIERPPLIAVAPILGGAIGNYLECRIFGRLAAGEGYASYFLHQDERLLKPFEHATDLERRTRSWVRSMIKALDLLLDRYPLDETRLGSFGISLGGIRSILLAGAEPRFSAHVVCMAGGDLVRILGESRERLVREYLTLRSAALRVSRERVLSDFTANFVSDPLRIAPSVDPESVLFFVARHDDKVPTETGWLLHDALGRPECRTSPLGHYTSIVVLPWAIGHSYNFFAKRFEANRGVDAIPPGGQALPTGTAVAKDEGLQP